MTKNGSTEVPFSLSMIGHLRMILCCHWRKFYHRTTLAWQLIKNLQTNLKWTLVDWHFVIKVYCLFSKYTNKFLNVDCHFSFHFKIHIFKFLDCWYNYIKSFSIPSFSLYHNNIYFILLNFGYPTASNKRKKNFKMVI